MLDDEGLIPREIEPHLSNVDFLVQINDAAAELGIGQVLGYLQGSH